MTCLIQGSCVRPVLFVLKTPFRMTPLCISQKVAKILVNPEKILGEIVMSDSVTHLIGRARAGDEGAAQKLCDLYFERLAGLARKQLPRGERRVADEEDIANIALA